MNADANPKTRYGLTEATAPLLSFVPHIRVTQELGDPEGLRTRVVQAFADFEREAREQGLAEEDVRDAKYAIAALFDEMILNSAWPGKLSWRPLQVEFFGVHMAGEEFFHRLDALRNAAGSRIEALEIFYICLQLGFEGKYKILGVDKLKILLEEVGKDIARVRGRELPPLSPHAGASGGLAGEVSREMPLWVWFVSCATLVFLVYSILAFWIGADVDSAVEGLRAFVGAGG